jgi:hypothetical protein
MQIHVPVQHAGDCIPQRGVWITATRATLDLQVKVIEPWFLHGPFTRIVVVETSQRLVVPWCVIDTR